jgi:hypothetical protein
VSNSKRLRFALGLQNLIDVAVQIPKRSFKDKTESFSVSSRRDVGQFNDYYYSTTYSLTNL